MMNVQIDQENFSDSYIKLIKLLMELGTKKLPRGQNISCFQNCLFTVRNPGTIFSSPSREYPFSYLNKELKLYFTGNCSAEDFGKASKFWLQLANPDGNIK